ncbi:MAG: sigma-70 family RNA polymerase sigma factor [Cryobacterium sp.]|nr:sigma-70 family RNA polymerase sigma factor [Cryobacterium sp.]
MDKIEHFDSLFKDNYGLIFAFARRLLRDSTTAEDVTEEVFLLAWQELDSIRSNERAWLFGTARNRVSQYYRIQEHERQTRTEIEVEIRNAGDTYPGASIDLSEKDQREEEFLRAEIMKLTEHERQVLVLTYWLGMNAKKVSRVLGCSENVVWVSLSRSRKALRSKLIASRKEKY